MNVLVNAIVKLGRLPWDWLAHCRVDLLHKGRVQVRRDNDVLFAHFLDVCVRLLILPPAVVELNQLSEDVSQTDRLLNAWHVYKRIAQLYHGASVALAEGVSCTHEFFDVRYAFLHYS